MVKAAVANVCDRENMESMIQSVQNWQCAYHNIYTSPDLLYVSPIFTPHTDVSSCSTAVETVAVTACVNAFTKTSVTPMNVGNEIIVGA
jgi:hypothetical protein